MPLGGKKGRETAIKATGYVSLCLCTAITCSGRLSPAGKLGRRKMYQVAQMDESCFGDKEQALMKSVVEDDSMGCIPIRLTQQ